ncbi:DsbA family oxidoreductase [Geodermatophilus ruber]|uniref:Predicted dithiol-disulfide isomerase, DsbA family n=1 Tax=Geodermatophilus ruber TaxID=504800 RepID=A0A1I4H579_9ACTN|nr:DsbA family protein [Geodermatophilus ruber]SFL36566.1 Predicted dithiol-disulfide isomerase, DsbA family [Geodermatophilus ruber]
MTALEVPELTEPLRNPAPGVVTVWSDIGCPWASLALHTLHRRAAERDDPLLVDHRAFPLELFNRRGTPKLIIDVEVVAIAAHCPDLGWRPWTQPDSTYPVTMLPAMEAVQAAKDPAVGGLRASDELDAALRRAFYAEGRCISVHSVILDVAEQCAHVDAAALAGALARGAGRREVYAQWEVAQRPDVQGSPHLFAAGGFATHNPGATYHWTAAPPDGFPRLEEYRTEWAEELLDLLSRGA